jgi:ribosomal protein S18 acetylase RimI-like enzyme
MIRDAVPSDLAAVLAIGAAGFAPTDRPGPGWLVKKLAQPGRRLLVDTIGPGVIRGFLLTESHPTGTVARIVAVAPEFRRQGIGRGLLATIDGPGLAWVRTRNTASQALFTAAGWTLATPPRPRRAWLHFTQD